MALPETMVVSAEDLQRFADEMRRRATFTESIGTPLHDEEARMLYAAAGALQGLSNKLRKDEKGTSAG